MNAAHTITVSEALAESGSETTQIVTMNVIRFDGFELTKLEMDFVPRVR